MISSWTGPSYIGDRHGSHGDGHGSHGDGHESHGDGHEGHGDGHESHYENLGFDPEMRDPPTNVGLVFEMRDFVENHGIRSRKCAMSRKT